MMKFVSFVAAMLLAVSSFASAAIYVTIPVSGMAYPNTTTDTWNGVTIELLSAGMFDLSAPMLAGNLDLDSSTPTKLVFLDATDTVAPSEVLYLSYTVLAEIEGKGFDYHVEITPTPVVPEPATLAMLGLGAVGFIRKRTR